MTERGSASLLAVAVSVVVVVASLVATDIARMVDVRLKALAAADAAALAAAPLTIDGNPVAEATRFAQLNQARLVSCKCPVDPSPIVRWVTVVVEIPVDTWIIPARVVTAVANAEFDPLA